jgi:hypothetical protein
MYIYENIRYFLNYLMWCGILYISYPITHLYLNKFYVPYQNINPKHKQQYFISNMIKGLVLGYCSYNATIILLNYTKNIWNLENIKYLGAIYASTDMVSIFKVEKMQINTIIHHILVQILFMISLFILNFNHDSLALGIVIYAIFSTLAFSVNLYLALRLTIDNDKVLKTLATTSGIIYQFCCTINWVFQIYFLFTRCEINVLFRMFYFAILGLIIFDDLVLIKYLIKNSFLGNK